MLPEFAPTEGLSRCVRSVASTDASYGYYSLGESLARTPSINQDR